MPELTYLKFKTLKNSIVSIIICQLQLINDLMRLITLF